MMRIGSLLLISLFNSDAFGRLQGRFALKIGCPKQPWELIWPSHAKGCENDAKWTPRGAFGSTLGLRKRCQQTQKVLFRVRILGVFFRRSLGPHFVHERIDMAWRKWCLDCTGVSGSHICRFLKKSSPGQLFLQFWRRFRCPTEPRGRLLAQKAVKCGRSLRSCCQSYGNRSGTAATQPQPISSQRAKSI